MYLHFIAYFSNIQTHGLFKYVSIVCLHAHTSVYRYMYAYAGPYIDKCDKFIPV